MPIRWRQRKDHPRRCGENGEKNPRRSYKEGSPPQVRGKLSCRKTYTLSRGITPAGAGKTALYAKWDGMEKDHPRRCGENFGKAVNVNVGIGSPPQVRGKLDFYPLLYNGIWDHPRRCGENAALLGRTKLTIGSPPQVRGKHPRGGCCFCPSRITPAGAGKTPLYFFKWVYR